MSSFTPQPQPKTELGRYRLLSPSAGVRVSPICLGTMSLGQAWSTEMAGVATQEEAFKYLDKYWESGGNFLDTSNNYQNGESESIIGAWTTARDNRDQMVIATKYTIGYMHHRQDVKIKVNYQGNHRKSLVLSLEDSLRKLQTTYVDLLYVHWWDYSTSIPELMQALDSLVKANKVLYLGISDTPAWIVVKANEYARAHGMAQFVVYSGIWSIGTRDIERDIVPMCRAEGMGVTPWVLSGKYKSEEEIKSRDKVRYGMPQTEEDKKISAALDRIARSVGGGATIASVAVAWALAKCPYVFPVIGGKSEKQLDEVIKGLEIALTVEQMQELEAIVPLVPGFPYNFFGFDPAQGDGHPNYMVNAAGWVKFVKAPAPLAPGP
ncbi:norsolorinic acid reductase [Trametes coccinea BRFM310]|uniref:Norsolorinic acid reductase n=1 Tax=Trametes coccinea (strain BRFM310) TaxID=1353009 RepID=A0A1Y2IW18_TRAC3|nr:norsolorinic acid reductase [Trametes coccinea BRFM310]